MSQTIAAIFIYGFWFGLFFCIGWLFVRVTQWNDMMVKQKNKKPRR